MGIKARRDKQHLRLEVLKRWQPMGFNGRTKLLAATARRQWNIDHARRTWMIATVRIERVLKGGYHQHTLIVSCMFEHRLSAIAVMHVKIHNRHARQSMMRQRMGCGHRHIVDHAKTHRAVA